MGTSQFHGPMVQHPKAEIRQNAHLVSGPKGWQSHCGESGSQGEEEVRSFSSFSILYFKCFTSMFLEDFYLKVILGSTFVEQKVM